MDFGANPVNHAVLLPVIAKNAGIDEAAIAEIMTSLACPKGEEQRSAKSLGCDFQTVMKGVAIFCIKLASNGAALEAYESTINIGSLAAAGQMTRS
jgi:taurine transport system substrate-binding protein